MKTKKEVKFWNDTIKEITELNKHEVTNKELIDKIKKDLSEETEFLLEDQSAIVKQRLINHFASPLTGEWVIPEDMPFMKEFLNEVKKLTQLCDNKSVKNS